MRMVKKALFVAGVLAVIFGAGTVSFLVATPAPERITYGMSFNTPYARELGLDWKQTYDALLDELGVRHLRLAAHWPMVEPAPGRFNFSELDYQIRRAEEVGAEVIFGVGRRLPRWPECHIPDWAAEHSWQQQKESLRAYMRAVVARYKESPAITHWQVENEPYLEVFAFEHCGALDEAFLKEQITLVQTLDPSRPVLLTDSGNIGTWLGAYRHGDAFGTSVYLYFWTPDFGQFRTLLPPWWYRMKTGAMYLLFGQKETMLIELAVEPWLPRPIPEVPIDVQFSRMNLEKFNEIIKYARRTHFSRQYLWGAEWWLWLRERGHPEMWERGEALFQ